MCGAVVHGLIQTIPNQMEQNGGLSPRVRGKPPVGPGLQLRRGVYPRVYGETERYRIAPTFADGLSPRVRGNRARGRRDDSCHGSIPRVRGNRTIGRETHGNHGSIPACTGKPPFVVQSLVLRSVYPRVYGETQIGKPSPAAGFGLSPRVRGNLASRHWDRAYGRSIPACTGKPPPSQLPGHTYGVYPRVYGETAFGGLADLMDRGLSPRVRGNPLGRSHADARNRSIPACTGKPKTSTARKRSGRVYPRVYGETSLVSSNAFSASGLSPRVRGNRVRAVLPVHEAGSIPACTGKPPVSVDGGRGC